MRARSWIERREQCLPVRRPYLSMYLCYISSSREEQQSQRSPLPREITLPSAYHSPSTVKRNASEFVIGTVRLSSTDYQHRHFHTSTYA